LPSGLRIQARNVAEIFDPGGTAMLVLSRRAGERIQIGEQIEVTVVRIGPSVVRIGIEAPSEMTVLREEIQPDPHVNNRRSTFRSSLTSTEQISTA
jgi:carbon storage regulator